MLILKRKEPTSSLNVIKVGMITYYVIEVRNRGVLYDNRLTKLYQLNIPLYWFGSYYEFETFFSFFTPLTSEVFVIIF